MSRGKSQMEIMGLAIIVILLSLGLLFVLKFILLKPESTVVNEYKQSEMAVNFLNTLQDTNAPECRNIKFSTLFQDCAAAKVIDCSPVGDSCSYLYQTTKTILQDTFDVWKIKYYFLASTGIKDIRAANETRIIDPIGSMADCKGWKRGAQPLPLATPGDNLYLVLYICD